MRRTILAAAAALLAACSTKKEGEPLSPRRSETPMAAPARAIPAIDAEAATTQVETATFATG